MDHGPRQRRDRHPGIALHEVERQASGPGNVIGLDSRGAYERAPGTTKKKTCRLYKTTKNNIYYPAAAAAAAAGAALFKS